MDTYGVAYWVVECDLLCNSCAEKEVEKQVVEWIEEDRELPETREEAERLAMDLLGFYAVFDPEPEFEAMDPEIGGKEWTEFCYMCDRLVAGFRECVFETGYCWYDFLPYVDKWTRRDGETIWACVTHDRDRDILIRADELQSQGLTEDASRTMAALELMAAV